MPKSLVLLSTNDQDRTITVVVDGVKYEYWLGDYYEGVLRQSRALLAKKVYGTLITLLKTRSSKYDRLTRVS